MIFFIAGLLGGILSGFFKLGWEILLPPRTTERDETNPPQRLLQQLGFTKEFTHRSFHYSGHEVPYVSLIIHFGFSIVFGLLYAFLVPLWPVVSLWQGAVFGFVIWVAFHLVIMPVTRTVPSMFAQPFEEHFSELWGHVIWGFVIHVSYIYVLSVMG